MNDNVVYPRLHRRFGHSKMLKGQILLYPIIFTLCPLVSMSRRYFHEDNLDPITFILLGTMLALEALAQTIFISGDLLCTNAAPEKSLQSKYNAVVELVAKVSNPSSDSLSLLYLSLLFLTRLRNSSGKSLSLGLLAGCSHFQPKLRSSGAI